MRLGKKGEMTSQTLIPLIIAVAVIILAIFLYLLLSGKLNSAILYIKDLLRFGS